MLQNAYLLAKIGADTAENDQHFAEILPTDAFAPPGAGLRARPLLGRLPPHEPRGRLRPFGADLLVQYYLHLDLASQFQRSL